MKVNLDGSEWLKQKNEDETNIKDASYIPQSGRLTRREMKYEASDVVCKGGCWLLEETSEDMS